MFSLAVALCVLLCGCGLWMDGEYVSVKPHQEQDINMGKETITVSSYRQLRNALVTLVESGAEGGILDISGFNNATVHFYMDSAIQYVTHSTPVGAYAVDNIDYEIGTSTGTEAIGISIQYRRDRVEILGMQQIEAMTDARDVISEALSNCESSVVLQTMQYEDMDFVQLVRDYASENPHLIMETPAVEVMVYPERGTARIVELIFTYQNSRETLQNMQQVVEPVFTAAKLYVQGNEQVRDKYAQLYSFLMERSEYTLDTSITPAYSLLHHGVGDCKAFANVYAAMCKQAGLECYVVSGTRDGLPWTWNLIHFRGAYYHLDLLRSNQNGSFAPLRKSAMEGYVWDYSNYPG